MAAVVIVDDDDDLREIVTCVLEQHGFHPCFAFASLAELAAAGAAPLRADAALIDINLGENRPTGVDVYAWLKAHRFAGRLVFLTGHAATHPSMGDARASGTRILEKPVDAKTLVAALAS